MARKAPVIEIFKAYNDGDGSSVSWYFHLRARNGEIQYVSESYPTRGHALRGARQAQRNTAAAEIVVRE